MLTPQEIRARLRPMNLATVARETGLHYNTILRFVSGDDIQPLWSTVKRLSDWLEAQS